MIRNIYITPKNDLTFKLSEKYKNFSGFIDKYKRHEDIIDISSINKEDFQIIIYSPGSYNVIYLSLLQDIDKSRIVFYLPILNITTRSLKVAGFIYKIWLFLNKIHVYKKPKLSRYEELKAKYNIGKHSYAGRDIVVSNQKTKIGKYTSIANGVYLGTSQHPTNFLTTHPMAYSESAEYLYGDLKVESSYILDISNINTPVEVGNDCWIGTKTIIMDGVKIGHGAVIAAGAVVTRNVPPYAIVGGVPAKVIKYRFDQDTIDELLMIKWWDFPKEVITKLPFNNIAECIKILKSYQDTD
ncbi:MAG: CatB-related O-acetyltransferase [Aliarcobacter butzleri]|nr:CatB-related O-acetyltransferase [Aliarcobacter butzleri]